MYYLKWIISYYSHCCNSEMLLRSHITTQSWIAHSCGKTCGRYTRRRNRQSIFQDSFDISSISKKATR